MNHIADWMFYNGSIITANKDKDTVEAIAVNKGTIISCGAYEEVSKNVGIKTSKVNLNGKTLMPGFIDSHIHFSVIGLKSGPIIDITYEEAKSIVDILEKIEQAVHNKRPGQWIVLSGYDNNKLVEKRHPHKEELDRVAPDNPVRCIRCCAHMGVYNTKALEIGMACNLLKFNKEEIGMNNDRLTGLLKENAHMYMGKFVEFSEEELRESLKKSNQIMVQHGITTVCDAGADGLNALRLMEEGTNSRSIKVRITPMIFDLAGKEGNREAIENYLQGGNSLYDETDYFEIGPAKIMIDGSSSGPSAATRKPYSHSSSENGILVWQQDEVDIIVEKIHRSGMQVTAHAVGDRAVEIIVSAIEKAQSCFPRIDTRHRIEHCGLVDEELISKIKCLGIIPIANPGFIEKNGRDYNRFYGDRVNYMFPLRTFLEQNIPCAIGSDAPVIPPNPMLGLYGAISRRDGTTGEYVGASQKVNLMDAIKMYTYNGAYAIRKEDRIGSLEVGKKADLIILSKNMLECSEREIRETNVDFTMIEGEVVYERRVGEYFKQSNISIG